jgi:hypothetical protein
MMSPADLLLKQTPPVNRENASPPILSNSIHDCSARELPEAELNELGEASWLNNGWTLGSPFWAAGTDGAWTPCRKNAGLRGLEEAGS